MISWLRSLENRFALNTLGFVVALISIGFAIYVEYRPHGPGYTITVESEFDVFSVREDIPELQVIYSGIDLRSKGLKLHVITFEVKNDGAGDLPVSSYDVSDLPGLNIEGAKLIKVAKGRASNGYLQAKFEPVIISPTLLEFPRVMLDAGDSVQIKALLLAETKIPLAIHPKGKLLGIHAIAFRLTGEPAEEPSFWRRMIDGSLPVHLARAVAYVFTFIVAIIVIVAPIAAISEYVAKRRRRREIGDFKSLSEIKLSDKHDFIFHGYEDNGLIFLRRVHEFTRNPQRFLRDLKNRREPDAKAIYVGRMPPERMQQLHADVLPRQLIKTGYMVKTGEQYTPNKEMVVVLEAFFRFIRKRRKLVPETVREGVGPTTDNTTSEDDGMMD